MRLTKESCVGLVIDMQEKLFIAMSGKKALLKNSQILVSGLNELKIQTIVTQQYTKGLGETILDISSLIPTFTPIEKVTFSCCDEPQFVKALNEQTARNVLICGIEAHVCVLQTAIDLKEAGYNPIIIVDAVSSRKKSSVAIALERFRYEGIMVASTESILFELTKSAKAEEFKAISKLVR